MEIPQYIADQANAIAVQAEALAKGDITVTPAAAANLILSNAATLVAWTERIHHEYAQYQLGGT